MIPQDVTEPQLRAQASAVYMAVNTLAGGCGPLIVGAILSTNLTIFHLNDVRLYTLALHLTSLLHSLIS